MLVGAPRDPYVDPSTSLEARMPLLTQLFGSSDPQRKNRPSTSPAQAIQTRVPTPIDRGSRHDSLSEEDLRALRGYDEVDAGQDHTDLQWARRLEEWDAVPSAPSGAANKKLDPHASNAVDDASSVTGRAPFRQRMLEVDRRFKEQLEVRRGLSQALSAINEVQRQANAFQAQQRTLLLMESLRARQDAAFGEIPGTFDAPTAGAPSALSRNAPLPQPASSQRPQPPHGALASAASQASAKPAVNPLLKDILAAHSQPRGTRGAAATPAATSAIPKGRRGDGAKSEPTAALSAAAQRILDNAVRPVAEPRPYAVVRYVAVEPPSASPVQTAASQHTFAVESDLGTAYSEDFDKSVSDDVGSVGDDVSVATDSSAADSETSVADSVASAVDSSATVEASSSSSSLIEESISTNASTETDSVVSDSVRSVSSMSYEDDSDISDEVDIDSSSPARRRRRRSSDSDDGSNVVLSAVPADLVSRALQEFHRACKSANVLMAAVSGSEGTGIAPQVLFSHPERETEPKDATAGSSDKQSPEEAHPDVDTAKLTRKHFVDIRKLRKFNARVEANLRAIDVQRQALHERQKLLARAQKLSKANRKLRGDRALRLRDVQHLFADPKTASRGGGKRNKKSKKSKRGLDAVSESVGSSSASVESDYGFNFAGSDSGVSGDVVDEIESDFDFGGNSGTDDDSIEDEIEEDFGFGSADDDDDDSIEDEIDDPFAASSGVSDDVGGSGGGIVDEVGSDAVIDDLEESIDSADALNFVEQDIVDELAGAASDASSVSIAESLLDQLSYHSRATSSSSSAQSIATAVVTDEAEKEHEEGVRGERGDRDARLRTTTSAGLDDSLPSLVPSSDADGSSAAAYPGKGGGDGDDSEGPWGRWSDTDSGEEEEEEQARLRLDLEAEEALRELEEDLALTRQRRRIALGAVRAPTFSYLYDPNDTTPSLSSEEAEEEMGAEGPSTGLHMRLAALQSASERLTTAGMLPDYKRERDRLLASAPPKWETLPHLYREEVHFASERIDAREATASNAAGASAAAAPPAHPFDGQTTTHEESATLPKTNVIGVHYYPDDYVAQRNWKKRQLELFRQILPSSSDTLTANGDGTYPEEQAGERASDPTAADRHWGLLEALLETRFDTSSPHYHSDLDDWEDDDDYDAWDDDAEAFEEQSSTSHY